MSLAVAAIGMTTNHRFAGAVFSFCAMALAWPLVRPRMLILEPTGLWVRRMLGGSRRIAWEDVGPNGFFVFRRRRGGTEIGFNYRPEAVPENIHHGRLFGAGHGLSGQWPLSVEQMVDELNAFRNRTLRGVAGGRH